MRIEKYILGLMVKLVPVFVVIFYFSPSPEKTCRFLPAVTIILVLGGFKKKLKKLKNLKNPKYPNPPNHLLPSLICVFSLPSLCSSFLLRSEKWVLFLRSLFLLFFFCVFSLDLGFVFSLEDKNSSLASILPGLQRLGKKKEEEQEEEEEDFDEFLVPRPYLFEAWEFHEKRKKENPLMNWKVPSLKNEIDMKDSLRLWAHIVASTVR